MSEVGTFSNIRPIMQPPGLVLPTQVRQALATLPADFTGKIELNCFKGGIGNINIHWSVKTD